MLKGKFIWHPVSEVDTTNPSSSFETLRLYRNCLLVLSSRYRRENSLLISFTISTFVTNLFYFEVGEIRVYTTLRIHWTTVLIWCNHYFKDHHFHDTSFYTLISYQLNFLYYIYKKLKHQSFWKALFLKLLSVNLYVCRPFLGRSISVSVSYFFSDRQPTDFLI